MYLTLVLCVMVSFVQWKYFTSQYKSNELLPGMLSSMRHLKGSINSSLHYSLKWQAPVRRKYQLKQQEANMRSIVCFTFPLPRLTINCSNADGGYNIKIIWQIKIHFYYLNKNSVLKYLKFFFFFSFTHVYSECNNIFFFKWMISVYMWTTEPVQLD